MIFDRKFARLQNNQRQVLVCWKFVWKNDLITSLINKLNFLRYIIKYLTYISKHCLINSIFPVHFPKYDTLREDNYTRNLIIIRVINLGRAEVIRKARNK